MTVNDKAGHHPLGFLSLPAEIRVNILQRLLTRSVPIHSHSRIIAKQRKFTYRAALSSQILNTCSTLRNEGLPILLGQNVFLISRAGDVNLLKQSLPNQATDKHLIRHLAIARFRLLNITRIRELQSLRMIETVSMTIPPWEGYRLSPGQKLSLTALQADLERDLQQSYTKNLRIFLLDRPQVQCILMKYVGVNIESQEEDESDLSEVWSIFRLFRLAKLTKSERLG